MWGYIAPLAKSASQMENPICNSLFTGNLAIQLNLGVLGVYVVGRYVVGIDRYRSYYLHT